MKNIVAIVKMVPDLVEELEINEDGTDLDRDWLRLIINEFDNHAIEQAILLKEREGGEVTVIAPEAEGVEDMLFTTAAKGADRMIKLEGDFEDGVNNHALARAFAEKTKSYQPDLILTGVQANDDLDGSIGPLVAEYLGMPYVGYISGVTIEGEKALVKKEYPGGLIGEMEVTLPAVLGIQAGEEPPRYVAISKVRQMMKTSEIDEQEVPELDSSGGIAANRMYLPEAAERAEMIEGDEGEIAAKLVEIFKEVGAL
ncbi:MAG: electron transfer flavoprotein subunit beta [Anaerolineae bacterium]|jgi:electron transfer flavoprotein beta subunit|nr:electron transfer flavoprotein subunit beta [Anaerolineae bacterium]MBT4457382.1 electron transfer flavoprotein subunit beta [Anaerolineae bacterium]MBT4842924.1 electron transfer flavoprotein subunit beta [Anaerolineae bacterium]MBT6061310.1 electron transfer flavoprotein subunit beta [Anaerolineae bacterium]MBT6322113.1 electron transfer flavoprotein subunit beta [Anaerolineae bacterium]